MSRVEVETPILCRFLRWLIKTAREVLSVYLFERRMVLLGCVAGLVGFSCSAGQRRGICSCPPVTKLSLPWSKNPTESPKTYVKPKLKPT